jgi:hypothetical protein
MTGKKVAKAPCKSCPYRKDVPSGVWHASEYDKLPLYDGEIIEQVIKGATQLFDCHQKDGHLCAGWVGTHGARNLLAGRLHANELDPSVWDYQSPASLFASGQEACDHGKREIDEPGPKAQQIVGRLIKKREDIRLMPKGEGFKIRYREVISRKPVYGRYGEYQVVKRSKIVARFDMLAQALKAYPGAEIDNSIRGLE